MFTDGLLTMPDGVEVPFWGFEDPAASPGQKTMLSPSIRVREGEVAHVRLETCSTEPASKLDRTRWSARTAAPLAVQKSESYIYQWQPKSAGTWLYQSHASSAQNFEMGLFGLLIVDPEPDADGTVRAYKGGPSYDIERCWVLDDVDPEWHRNPSIPGQCGAGARPFAPEYFLVNGVPNTLAMHDSRVAIDAELGDKILIRLLNASYSLVRCRIEGLRGNIISADGKALASAERPWTKWSPVEPNHPVYLATGARNDILIDLGAGIEAGGDYLVTFEFLDWEKRAIRNANSASPVHVGRAVTRIRVR